MECMDFYHRWDSSIILLPPPKVWEGWSKLHESSHLWLLLWSKLQYQRCRWLRTQNVIFNADILWEISTKSWHGNGHFLGLISGSSFGVSCPAWSWPSAAFTCASPGHLHRHKCKSSLPISTHAFSASLSQLVTTDTCEPSVVGTQSQVKLIMTKHKSYKWMYYIWLHYYILNLTS